MRENNTLELLMPSSSPHDPAVSPVIGTMLLIALTVIFIAIVVAVVMGISSGMFDFKSVGLTLNPYGVGGENPEHGIGITIYGGANVADLVSLSAVITGPQLIYAGTNNNTILNPQVGSEYRLAAYVDPQIINAIKQGNLPVNLTTPGKQSVGVMTCYATITGKFRDGTEQVLLVQNIVIPAIPGIDGNVTDLNGYISVSPYTIREVYPGHGFKITILNKSIISLGNSVTFSITEPKTVSKSLTRDPNRDGEEEYTYDMAVPGGSAWYQTPYPETSPSKFWELGELTGDVKVHLTFKDGSTKDVTVGPIKVPPRVNFFEKTDEIYGTLSKNSTSIKVTFSGVNLKSDVDPNFVIFYSGNTTAPAYQTKLTNTRDYSVPQRDLANYHGQKLEVFALVKVKGTQVWYHIASG